ncbi:Alpha-(1,3)-fucosyltransferase C [Mizuhopecten yessoensis]|uniref:Fucosyltransferase n=1 Tax=Mizuhopecten yessoensis TaxID=6573 RepID=A0A210Q5B9_MIZYE|nr:Alpha-(1,3)-fucosyltransferase C [Mizuhopecten yessoensis]
MSFGKGQDYFNKDVVLFYGPTLWALPVVEKRRGQIWVLYGRKPPPYYKPLYRWNKLFNWTMTYRRDSDFLAVYGQFQPIPKPFNRLPKTTQNVNDVFDPTKYVLSSVNEHATAWFVSHCRTQSKREDYVKTLKKTHYVDIYGACGTLQCDESDRLQCLSSLKQKYKFYLSFENSLCRDYITEKSFDIYSNMLDVVPVTRGFCGIYSMYLPPGSFIDTSYYNDIDQLGHFLNYLSRNKTSYLRYFQWRKHYQVQYPDPFCELCDRMHEPNMTTKYYRLYLDIHRWFLGSPNASMCTKPRI